MRQTLKRQLVVRLIVGIGILATLLVASIAFARVAHAASPPSTMNFQGRLANSSGNIIPSGDYNMTFRIYSASTGGTPLWTEVRQTSNRVPVTNGLFSVQLGAVTALPTSLFNSSDLYFEITMATPATATGSDPSWESPMTPRNKLATSAFAFNAASLNGQTASDFAAASGSSSYIQNTTTAQAGASFNVGGTGRVGGAFTAAGSSTFTGAMAVNNTATFRAGSTTAFRIQNAGGTLALLSVDTTNSILQIGSATTDTTAVRLVLDSSSSASDPTGINGAMYYSTNKNKMRCYENGAWRNCSPGKGTPTVRTSNYSAQDGDFVLANAAGMTVTLPAPSAGSIVTVKRISSGGDVYVNAAGGVQIDDMTTDELYSQWQSQDYFSDGTKWYRV